MYLFDNEFIIMIERFFVIPMIGYLISHGFFAPDAKDWLVPVFDNVFGTLFVFAAYFFTHKKTVVIGSETETKSLLNTAWIRFSNFALKKKTVVPIETMPLPSETIQ